MLFSRSRCADAHFALGEGEVAERDGERLLFADELLVRAEHLALFADFARDGVDHIFILPAADDDFRLIVEALVCARALVFEFEFVDAGGHVLCGEVLL